MPNGTMILPKKGPHDATGKNAHNSRAPLPPPPIHDPPVHQEDFASVKGKSTSDSTDDSSGVHDRTPHMINQCSTSHLGSTNTLMTKDLVNQTFQPITTMNLGATSTEAIASIGMTAYVMATIIIRPSLDLLGFPQF